MKILIPKLGDTLKLSKNVTLSVKQERRNSDFLKKYLDKNPKTKQIENNVYEVSLKRGTELVVDRIYIRQQAESFDSITFRIPKDKGEISGRFFVSLDDAHKIEFTEVKRKSPSSITLKKALSNTIRELTKNSDRSCYWEACREAPEVLFKDQEPLLTIPLTVDLEKILKELIYHSENNKGFRFAYSETRESLIADARKVMKNYRDVSIDVIELEFYLYNGDYAVKFKSKNPLPEDFYECFSNLLNTLEYNFRTSTSAYKLYGWCLMYESKENKTFFWHEFNEIKEAFKAIEMSPVSSLTYGGMSGEEHRKLLTKLKRDENKRLKNAID